MGFLGIDQTTNQNYNIDESIGGGDSAIVTRGDRNTVQQYFITGDGELASQALDTANMLGKGAFDVSRDALLSVSAVSSNALGFANNVVKSGYATISDIIHSQSDLSMGVIGANSNLLSVLGEQNRQVLSDSLNRVADLKETQLTGGQNGTNKLVLYLGIALLAVFGFMFWTNRKH